MHEVEMFIAFGMFVIATMGLLYKIHVGLSAKISRVYERFDAFKRIADDKFTTEKVCKLQSSNAEKRFEEAFTSVKSDMKRLESKIDRILEKK